MQQPVSLKTMEQQAFRATLADGLWDVFVGCFVLIFAFAPILSESLGDFWGSFIFLPFWGVAYLAIWLARKLIVAPRMGTVRLGSARVNRLRKLNMIMLAITGVLFLIGLATVAFNEKTGNQYAIPVFGSLFGLAGSLLLLAGFSVAAFLLDYPRLFFYGFLLFAALPVGEWLYARQLADHHGFPVVFGVVAAIMILTGLVQFTNMIRANPVVQIEEP